MPRIQIDVSPSPPTTLEHLSLVGLYGLDENREWRKDAAPFFKIYDSKLWENYRDLGIHLDLTQGQVTLKDDTRYEREGRIFILEWMSQNPDISNSIDFVIGHGDLMIFMRTPYEKKEPWSYSVAKHKGLIYLKANDTAYYIRERCNISAIRQMSRQWGEKFPYVLTQPPKSRYDYHVHANKNAYGVYSASLGGHRLLYKSSIKAVKNSIPDSIQPEDCVDFKTNVYTSEVNFIKSLKWWAQNYLTGTPEIVCGLRNNCGIVKDIQTYDVNRIPEFKKAGWKPQVCLSFAKNLLTAIKDDIVKHPDTVYNISWAPPGRTIEFSETNIELSYVVPSKFRD